VPPTTLPDLRDYAHHRTDTDAAFEGTPVPGLTAEFYRRSDGDRIASVGRYTYHGRELLLAWGYVDEQHCRNSAVRDPRGGWLPATPGCPVLRVLRAGETSGARVTGLVLQTPSGAWLTTREVSEPDQPAAAASPS